MRSTKRFAPDVQHALQPSPLAPALPPSPSPPRSPQPTPAAPPPAALPTAPVSPTPPTSPHSAPDHNELAARIADLLSQGPTDAFEFECTLARLVRAREDRKALSAALIPVSDKGLTPQLGRGHDRDLPLAMPLRQLHTLTVNAAWLPTHNRGDRDVNELELTQYFRRLDLTLDRPPGMDPYALRTPADILTLRMAELAAHIADPGPVQLVSTPTEPDGWIDADELVARITEAESEGWQPWPLDFDQALLRLPQSTDSTTVSAAQRLVSPAGRRLAGWLRGGRPALPDSADLLLPTPDLRPNTTTVPSRHTSPNLRRSTDSPFAGHISAPRVRSSAASPTTGPPTPSTLIHLLQRGWYPSRPLADGSCWTVCWPTLLPGQPDLIAVAATWHPRHPDAHGSSCPTPLLTRLAHGMTRLTHDFSDGTLSAVARALTSRSPAKRADAAHALATLAASGRFDADRFATALATFATRTDRQFLRSAVPTLQLALTASAEALAPVAAPTDTSDRGTIPTNTSDRSAAPAGPSDRVVASAGTSDRTTVSTGTSDPVASDRVASDSVASFAIGTAILGWLPAILPPTVDQPLPYTSHLLNLAADALASTHTPSRLEHTPKYSPTVSAALEALTPLASRPSRSPVSDAAQRLVATITQAV